MRIPHQGIGEGIPPCRIAGEVIATAREAIRVGLTVFRGWVRGALTLEGPG